MSGRNAKRRMTAHRPHLPLQAEEFLMLDGFDHSNLDDKTQALLNAMRDRGIEIYISADGGTTAEHVGVMGAITLHSDGHYWVAEARRAEPMVLSPTEFERLLDEFPGGIRRTRFGAAR